MANLEKIEKLLILRERNGRLLAKELRGRSRGSRKDIFIYEYSFAGTGVQVAARGAGAVAEYTSLTGAGGVPADLLA